jgi:hypothetical protein
VDVVLKTGEQLRELLAESFDLPDGCAYQAISDGGALTSPAVATVIRRCKCRTAEQRTSCACPRRDIRWRARHGQGRNEVSRTFASEQEARTWLATVVADQARGLYVDHRDGRRLIKDWAAEWKAAQLHSANTAARVSWAIDVHIAPHFGQLPIGRLTRLRVQTWIRSLEALGYAPETIASLYSVLGSVMAAAVDEGLIPASPCRRVQLPRNDRPERPFIDETEGLRLALARRRPRAEAAEACKPYGLLVVTALFTGLAVG